MNDETGLVIIALLMRIYDVQMSLLSHMYPEAGIEVYEAHERAEHFNPPIFIPKVEINEQ